VKMVVYAVVAGIVITLLTGLIGNTPEMLVGRFTTGILSDGWR